MIKKILIFSALCFLPTSFAAAAESGDIFYSNRTTEEKIVSGKTPAGIVWWAAEEDQSGIVIALDQPPMKSLKKAENYCRSLRQGSRHAGEWHLPQLLEFLPIDKLKNTRADGSRLERVNRQLQNLRNGDKLKNEFYLTSTGAGQTFVAVNPFTGEMKQVSPKQRLYFRCVTKLY